MGPQFILLRGSVVQHYIGSAVSSAMTTASVYTRSMSQRWSQLQGEHVWSMTLLSGHDQEVGVDDMYAQPIHNPHLNAMVKSGILWQERLSHPTRFFVQLVTLTLNLP